MLNQMTINSQTYKGSFSELLEYTAEFGGQVNVWTPKGAVVLIAEEDLRGMLATLEIESNPKYKEELLAAMAEPLSECVPWEEIEREGDLQGAYSRRINAQHRLVYEVKKTLILFHMKQFCGVLIIAPVF